jgi:hypothetical protein
MFIVMLYRRDTVSMLLIMAMECPMACLPFLYVLFSKQTFSVKTVTNHPRPGAQRSTFHS